MSVAFRTTADLITDKERIVRSRVSSKKNFFRASLMTPLWLAGVIILYSKDAYAYIDPGTRSMIMQLLVGVFLALGITSKFWWRPLKRLVLRLLGKQNGQSVNEQ